MKKTLLCLSMLIASSAAMASQNHIAGLDYQGYNFDDHKFFLSFDATKMSSGAEAASYQWEFIALSGNTAEATEQDVHLKKANKANATFTFSGDVHNDAGAYSPKKPVILTFKLTVTDTNGKATEDYVSYSLYEPPTLVSTGTGKKSYTFGKYYKVGDIVTYKEKKFQCVRGLSGGPTSGAGFGTFNKGEPCTFGTMINGVTNSYEPDGGTSGAYSIWRPIGVTKNYEVRPFSSTTYYRLGDRVKYNGKTYQCGGHPSGSSYTTFCSMDIYEPESNLSNLRNVWMDVKALGNNKLPK